MNRLLKILRIAVSLLILLTITAALTAVPLTVPAFAQWIEHIQLLPAVITFSLGVFISWLIITLIFGRLYCSTVCPLGTLMDISSRIRLTISPQVYRYSFPLRVLSYCVLALVVVCLMAGFFAIPLILDPYTAYSRICREFLSPVYSLFCDSETVTELYWCNNVAMKALTGWAGASIAAITLVIVVVLSAKKGRILCNTVCPVGTTLGFISRFAIFQIDIDTDKCINCRNCEYICKSCCINLNDHVVDGSRCVNCFDCINVCPNDAIHYTFRRKQLSIPMMKSVTPILPKPSLENSSAQSLNKEIENNINDETIS